MTKKKHTALRDSSQCGVGFIGVGFIMDVTANATPVSRMSRNRSPYITS